MSEDRERVAKFLARERLAKWLELSRHEDGSHDLSLYPGSPLLMGDLRDVLDELNDAQEEIRRGRAQLEVAHAAVRSAVCTAEWQARTNSELNELQAERDAAREALEKIVEWSQAYPLSVFPEADLKRAAEVLRANGMSIDSFSAHVMRHVITGIAKIARGGLHLDG